MKDITIYQIAKLAGVSASTVSRVITNYPYVKKETRAKVLKILSEVNYVPNEMARNLVKQTSNTVGILISDIRTNHHTDGVYYIEREFSKNGYSCLIYNTGPEPDNMARYIRMLGQKKVDAVILMGSIYQNKTVQSAIMLNLSDVPVAICNGYLDGPNIYGVVADEKNGVVDCMELLARKRHRHVAFLANHWTPSNLNKCQGFKEGFDKFFGDGCSYKIVETGVSIEDVRNATIELMKANPEIDGIIYSEDFIAMVGLRSLLDLGIKIPDQVAIVGINNSRYAEFLSPSLTSLDNMLFDTSLIAVRNIIEVLRGERVNKKIMICSEVVERETT